MKRGILKRKTRLRPVSKKTRKRIAEVKPIRDAYRAMFDRCQYPQCRELANDTHEITNASRRSKSLGERAVLLNLCRAHHDELTALPLELKWSRQLAIKMLADREGYSLEAFRKIMGRGDAVIVTQEEINAEADKYLRAM